MLFRSASGMQPPTGKESRSYLHELQKDIHIEIFVTPTCRFCPATAVIGQSFAAVSDRITTDVIEIDQFPELARKFVIRGVPAIAIDDVIVHTGEATEKEFLALLRRVEDPK